MGKEDPFQMVFDRFQEELARISASYGISLEDVSALSEALGTLNIFCDEDKDPDNPEYSNALRQMEDIRCRIRGEFPKGEEPKYGRILSEVEKTRELLGDMGLD